MNKAYIKNIFICLLIAYCMLLNSASLVLAQEASGSAETATQSAETKPTTPTPTITTTPDNPFSESQSQTPGSVSQADILQQSLQASLTSPLQNLSAIVRQPMVVHALSKKTFQRNEAVSLDVSNATATDVQVEVLNKDGNAVANIPIEKITNGTSVTVTLLPPAQTFTPGKYTVRITDNSGNVSEQDFTWGVLAINPDKSIYVPGDTANFAMAVLDESGNMVCDATVTLAITDPLNKTITLITPDGVQVTKQCLSHDISETPDYQANYQVGAVGDYTLSLTAQTKNGTYTIQDGFSVQKSVSFLLNRHAPTRIYPINAYPVKFDITANEDFAGTVREYVPTGFAITPLAGTSGTFVQHTTENHVSDTLSSEYLNMPFSGIYKETQGFGVPVTDPQEKSLYTQYGLLGHDGLDFALPIDTPVLAVDNGKIIFAGAGAYGNTIVIQHSWGRSYYGHLHIISVHVNDLVARGDQIALSGDSGLAIGAHLHFGIRPNNPDMANGFFGKIDPTPYLDFPKANTHVLAATTSLNADWKQISWDVSLKKGESITLGYTFQAPPQSPQFYTLGPLQFFSTTAGFTFGELRQWEVASDATNTYYLTSTAGSSPYPSTSWTFATTANASSNVTTFAQNAKNTGFYMFKPGATNATNLGSTASTLPTTVQNTGWIYTGTNLDGLQTDAGTWTINYKYSVTYTSGPTTKILWYRVLKATCASGSCTSNAVISPTDASAPSNSGWAQTTIGTLPSSGTLSSTQSFTFSGAKTIFASGDKLYVEFAINSSSTGSNSGGWKLEANTSSDNVVTSNVSTPPPVLNQVHFRWRNDDGSETAATWRRTEDTADNKNYSNGNIRIRVEISNKTGGSSATSYAYQLEYGSEASLGNCSSILTWTAVPTSGSTDFNITSSTFVTDATATTAQLTADTTNFVAGQVKTTANNTSGITLAKTTDYTELEWSIQPAVNAGNTGKPFCFRLTNAGSTTNFTYTVYPELTVGQPTINQNHFIFRQDNGPESATSGNSIYLSPVGAGFATNFTIAAGCTSNWDCVNDNASNAPSSTTSPTSDSATSALTMAAASDYYILSGSAIIGTATITSMTITAYAIQSQNPGGTLTLGYCLSTNCGTTNVMGTGQSVNSGTYTAFTQNFSGLSLTNSDINSMQLIVNGSNTRVQVSTVYVQLTYSLASATAMAVQDTNASGVQVGGQFRLRIETANTGGVAGTRNYKLQYAQYVGGACGTYADIPVSATSEPFQIASSNFFTNGSATTTQLTATGSFIPGVMVETPSNSSGPISMSASSYTENEYALIATPNATVGSTYCFQLVDTSQGALDVYSVTPMLTMYTPTLDLLMRHGQWFSGHGVIQPFTF